MNRNHKLIAGAAAVALVAGGGAAFAAVELVSSHSDSAPAVQAPYGRGIGGFGLAGRLGGRGFGGGLGRGGQQRFGRGFGFLGRELSAAASYLGLTSSALLADLRNGQTLAQVASARSKPLDGLVTAMVAAQTKQIDAAAADGRLTHAEAQSIEANMAERARDFADGTSPGFGRAGAGDRAPGGGTGGGSGSFGATT